MRDARDQPPEGGHLLRLHELDLGVLQLGVSIGQLAVGRLELPRALAHALLEARVERGQGLVGGRVLERDRGLVGERAQELRVGGGVEESRSLRPRAEDADQLAPQQQRDGNLRPEHREASPGRFLAGAVGVELGRVERGHDPSCREAGVEGSGDGRPPADRLQQAVDADVELGPRVRDRLFDRAPEDGGNLVALERRGELGSDRREHLRGIVARAEEDPVDERLEPGPERIEEEEHGEREEHGEGGRIGHRTRPEAEVEEHDRPDVRRAHRTREKEVVGAALHHRVDLEQVVLHDGVGEREQEEEDRHGGRVHGRAATRDRRGQHDQQGQAQAEEGAEGHHPDTLAGQRGAPAAIAPHETHGGEHPDQPQVEHVQGQHVGVDRRPVEGPLVDREDRERDGIARQPPAGVAVRVGKEQRQLEQRRG